MSLSLGLQLGTGRAWCRGCRENILKGQLCISVSGYNASGKIHFSEKDCSYLLKRMIELNKVREEERKEYEYK